MDGHPITQREKADTHKEGGRKLGYPKEGRPRDLKGKVPGLGKKEKKKKRPLGREFLEGGSDTTRRGLVNYGGIIVKKT